MSLNDCLTGALRRSLLLGLLLFSGLLLAQQNKPLDISALSAAAERGDVHAQVILGKAYLLGEKIDKDDDRGVFWLREAARNGDRVGQAWLGWAYEQGRGVRKDAQRAYSWYSRSARQGYEWAQQQLGHLEQGGEVMATEINRRQEEIPLVTRRAATPMMPGSGNASANGSATGGSSATAPVVTGAALAGAGLDATSVQRPVSVPAADIGTAQTVSSDPRQIGEQLRAWVEAQLVTTIPDKVAGERLAVVMLELPSPPQLVQWQAAGIGVRVQADLQVDGTVVDPLTKPEQALRPQQRTRWRWEVQALESGMPLLDLALAARVQVPDHEPYRVELMRLGPRVAVQPPWGQRVWKLIRENQLAIGLTVLVPLFLWLGMSFAGRRR